MEGINKDKHGKVVGANFWGWGAAGEQISNVCKNLDFTWCTMVIS